MAEASVATPGSPAESGTPAKTPAAKDKSCPFCNQTFTSSSLGRHLDLYIKDKNPKPPDGVHNADEIRRLRGNVTRRQARNSSSKREGSTPSSVRPSVLRDQRSPSVGRHYHNGDQARKEKVITRLNEANWQATGVINNLPLTPRDDITRPDPRRDSSRRTSVKYDIVRRHEGLEERDNGRAAELALKEVLGSIRAASTQANPPSPFDSDILCLTFPAMCLRYLSTPPTIFSTHPIATNRSWSVETPGPAQLESLQRWLENKLQNWRQGTRDVALEKEHLVKGMNGHMARHQLETQGEEEAKYTKHLHDAFQAWKALPEKQKQETWRVESLHAYAREQGKRKEAETRLRRVEQEAQHLRAQVDQLSKCQQPREFVLFPPKTLPLPAETAKAASETIGFDTADWDYDRLVAKWKNRLQHDRNMAGQIPLPNAPKSWNFSTPAADGRANGMPAAAAPPSSTPRHLYQEHTQPRRVDSTEDAEHDEDYDELDVGEDGGDMEDAPGEEEDVAGEQARAPEAMMTRGVLDPNLRDHTKETESVMDGIEGDGGMGGEGYRGGPMLMGIRDYGGMNGGMS